MRKLIIIVSILITLVFTPLADADILFSDSLESGDFTHVDPLSGAAWGESTYTTVSTDNPRTGAYSIKFRFVGNEDLDADAWSEQRFKISDAPQTEIYIRYYIWFPESYTIRATPSTENTKFIYIWGDSYADDTNKIGFELQGDMQAGFTAKHTYPSGVKTLGCVAPSFTSEVDSPSTRWTLTEEDKGKWLCFEFRYKIDSGAGDGALQFWVDGELIIDGDPLSWLGAPCGVNEFLRNGYLMGWSNSGFDEDTIVYIDDVVFSTNYIGPDVTPETQTRSSHRGGGMGNMR
ncbi:MAG: hypothetical protein KKE62_02040 [Proteobacteria bacterium]|nr:hypothetical protein [Pseudomonadota bacterium]MBU1387080.1 hypothetical protein [Pseudomonadota bacterium]MBU1541603.1 hypothetical protein [Pseudomonadota bacterium]MBU2479513.1 hypothetical protein [Pseudomonadota bacterium]